MKRILQLLSALPLIPDMAVAGVELSGRLAVPDSRPEVMLAAVRVFGFPAGSPTGAGFRTWEMEPRGWWKLEGAAGNWTVLFTGPAHFVRPCLLSVLMAGDARNSSLRPSPRFDSACFGESEWDPKPAAACWQPFTAKSTSVTHVGFKLATDGVDGAGPGSQTMLLSVHRCGDGPPETWPQTGPAMPVPGVDCGGPKSYHYSAGWHSGEVPMEPGKRYAVKIRPEKPGSGIQVFREKTESDHCLRAGPDGKVEVSGFRMWLTVSGDGDGLTIPCNKRIHREFGTFAGYRTGWTQTWTARGASLCGVMLYTATSGTQPRMEHQRIAVRIHRDGPDGPVIGPEKIAAVSASYTGDAAWGVIAAVFPKDEVKLTPGAVYAAEFTTLETPESIGSFVNFKGQVNDRKPGFNPYLRHELDAYAGGSARDAAGAAISGDLDMQVIEYE